MSDNFGVSGQIQVWSVDENTKEKKFLFEQKNQIQVFWGNIFSKLLQGDQDYRISALYMEYKNVATPATTVSAPAFTEYAGVSYYTGLSSVANTDFLRTSLIQTPTLGIVTGYESYFTEGVSGNQLTFYAQSSGTTGVHSKAFANASNSKVYGVALVATPVIADYTQDVIMARTYFIAANQVLKQSASQIGVSWTLKFTV